MGCKKILIVEDNQINAKLLVHYLKHKGFDTIHIDNGNDVLPITIKERPDIILMDIDINGISGVDACNQVKCDPELKNLPIIAVTSFSKQRVIGELEGKLFDDYVQKPIIFNDFGLMLEKYI